MIRVPFEELRDTFGRVLNDLGFHPEKADLLAETFAQNSLDGVYSHGLNRFPSFIEQVKKGVVVPDAEPEMVEQLGAAEIWDGQLAPGIYAARRSMQRAMELAGQNGIGCVAIRNTNHWLRGGTYGWQAADAGFSAICFTNASASMAPWGGEEPRLGNNPLVIAVPREGGNIVLDMAISQFSYGKLQEYSFAGKELPFDGGYDEHGDLTRDPEKIAETKRALPIGYWKGSGLAMLIDVLLVALTGGKSVAGITRSGHESSVCQCFIAFKREDYNAQLIEEIIRYNRSSVPEGSGKNVRFPGENTLLTRRENRESGIPVEEKIWNALRAM
ncbi:MAG: 3-dehydro-L-gulonate 2-dehydrogenase [Mucilaginibacter polytrichastri]|nr:3-dehydro-L-gulonate 2-dehydrogenase [Mucilaginibacter polytrichastri]